MRPILALAVAPLLVPPAAADIIAIRFKSPKVANRFKEHLVPRGGEFVLVGEHYETGEGVAINTTGVPSGPQPIQVIVADPSDPTNVSYKIEIDKNGEEKLIFTKKKLVAVNPDDTVGIMLLMQDGTLATLAADYVDRRREIDELLDARDVEPKGSVRWMATHQQAMLGLERLESWLRSTLYPGAADKLAKEIEKQRKGGVVEQAVAERKAAALGSLKEVETPAALIEAAQAISAGADKYKVQESLHARIIYREGVDDVRVRNLLVLTEEIIEGVRVEFVDPYLDSAYEDYIRDHVFVEWFFGYDDPVKLDRYWTEYYRQHWDKNKEERLKNAGHNFQSGKPPESVHYWKTADNANLEGMVAHNLGHDLAGIHFDRRRMGSPQDWIGEGLALFISLEWLGSNPPVSG